MLFRSAYRAKDDFAAALADYIRAIESDPKSASAYSNRGVVLSLMGDHAAAVADYSKVIELSPKNGAAFRARALDEMFPGPGGRAPEAYAW